MNEPDNSQPDVPTTDNDSAPAPAGADAVPVDGTPTQAAPVSPVEVSSEQPIEGPSAGQPPVGAPDSEPTQTDNTERPEDGEQDVSQDPNQEA